MITVFREPCNTYNKVMSKNAKKDLEYNQLSPFEFKNILLQEAKKNKSNKLLNAGRGNPNFFSTLPRLAFALLTKVCTLIGEDMTPDIDMGLIPDKKGISTKFRQKLKYQKSKEAKFLKNAIREMQKIACIEEDDFYHNLVISTIGCLYPTPPRVQPIVETYTC